MDFSGSILPFFDNRFRVGAPKNGKKLFGVSPLEMDHAMQQQQHG